VEGQKQQTDIKVIDYKPELQPIFEKLNREWIELYFEMEPLDYEILQNPEPYIIDKGGSILFAETGDGEIVGTIALELEGENIIKLLKLAVTEKARGRGAGKLLCEAVLERAWRLGAKKVILYTNTILEPAVQLYRRLGFREVPVGESKYERVNLKMEIDLRQ
jgi:GNAT superfamily N-acetyltransferase